MIVIYLIDARTVLDPRNEVDNDEVADWSCIGLFDQDKQSSGHFNPTRVQTEAGLDIVEIATVSFQKRQRDRHSSSVDTPSITQGKCASYPHLFRRLDHYRA